VPPRRVERARIVHEKGKPELISAVQQGKLSISQASIAATLEDRQQRFVIELVQAGDTEMACAIIKEEMKCRMWVRRHHRAKHRQRIPLSPLPTEPEQIQQLMKRLRVIRRTIQLFGGKWGTYANRSSSEVAKAAVAMAAQETPQIVPDAQTPPTFENQANGGPPKRKQLAREFIKIEKLASREPRQGKFIDWVKGRGFYRGDRGALREAFNEVHKEEYRGPPRRGRPHSPRQKSPD
jgi:hypothetical protein